MNAIKGNCYLYYLSLIYFPCFVILILFSLFFSHYVKIMYLIIVDDAINIWSWHGRKEYAEECHHLRWRGNLKKLVSNYHDSKNAVAFTGWVPRLIAKRHALLIVWLPRCQIVALETPYLIAVGMGCLYFAVWLLICLYISI